ncbi:MAG: sigma-70 family RNA polymerase sigma factor [Planctomycetes bacterium]|nr:sigma-70 family RNA polymerase sigma factor [Planctomycetota bacterium]
MPPESKTSSEELARRARAGCREAFGELVLRFEGSLLRFLCTRVPTESEAEELAQETFLRAWTKLALYDPEQRFSTWLFTLARHLAVSRGRRRRLVLAEDGDLEAVAQRVDAGGELAEREQSERLWKLADEVLTPDQREALWLKYAEDLSAEEIGRVLGKRDVAVRVLLFRARAKLARELEAERERADSRRASASGSTAWALAPGEA